MSTSQTFATKISMKPATDADAHKAAQGTPDAKPYHHSGAGNGSDTEAAGHVVGQQATYPPPVRY